MITSPNTFANTEMFCLFAVTRKHLPFTYEECHWLTFSRDMCLGSFSAFVPRPSSSQGAPSWVAQGSTEVPAGLVESFSDQPNFISPLLYSADIPSPSHLKATVFISASAFLRDLKSLV